MLNAKATIVLLKIRLIKKDIMQISEYLKPRSLGGKVKV